MAMIGNLVGLDLGSYSLKAVEFRQGLRQLEPVQFRCEPRQMEGVPDSERLLHFLESHALPKDAIYCSIAGHLLSSRRLEFPFTEKKKLDRAVPFELEDEIPFELEDILVEWEPIQTQANQAAVAAVMVARTEVQAALDPFHEIDVEPRLLEADGFVLANLASLFDLAETQLLVDLGHRKTQLSLLVEERVVLSRTLPVGGKALTKALAQDRGCSIEEAERAKCEDGIFATGLEAQAPKAMEILDRIAREIARTIQAPTGIREESSHLPIVTLIGGSSKLHKIDEYLSERTGVATRRLALPPDSNDAALVAGGDAALYATATALALRGTSRRRTGCNFRKEEFAYRPGLRSYLGPDLRGTLTLAALVTLLLIVQVSTSVILGNQRSRETRDQVAAIYAEAFPGQPIPSNPLSAMRQQVTKAQERAEFLGTYGNLQSALDLLVELSSRIPPELELYFDELRIDRSAIRIKVHAKNYEAVDRLKNLLSSEEPFLDTRVAGDIQKDKRRGGVTFNLNIATSS